MAGFVSGFSSVFANFEKSLKGVQFKKIELQQRDAKITEEYCNPYRTQYRGGIESEFVRLYQDINQKRNIGFIFFSGSKDLSDGIYQMIDSSITVSAHSEEVQMYQKYSVDEFKTILKGFYKNHTAFKSYEEFFEIFKKEFFTESSEVKIVRKFDKYVVVEDVKESTAIERENFANALTEQKKAYQTKWALEKNIQEKLRVELERIRKEEGWYDVVKTCEDADEKIKNTGEKFVEKVKSHYNNYNISIGAFLFEMSSYFKFGYFSNTGLSKLLEDACSKMKK